jgi:Protein of unknown function (DUF3072)
MTDRTDRDEPTTPGSVTDLRPEERPGLEKDPSDWVTGEEPMTGAQASYLETLARQTGVDVEPDLTKAQASEKIDELRSKAGFDENRSAG